MIDQQPPRIATWMAERLVPHARRESLVGDLMEQYRHGRSDLWYWRQVFVAIVAASAHDLAAHKSLAFRGLAIGWTLYYVCSFPVTWAGRSAERWAATWLLPCDPQLFWCQFWLNQISVELLIYVAAALSGWVVVRLHRTSWFSIVALYSASVFLFECGAVALLTLRGDLPVSIAPAAVMLANATIVVRPLSIILGGMWAARSDLRTSNTHA
jgi:hypothetical protein